MIAADCYANSECQLPAGNDIYLDHVGCFVADPNAAARALSRLGFSPTPISIQVNPDPSGGPPVRTGTGNVCVMLDRGYLEFLFKTADTPLGRQFESAFARYPGFHLIAFAVADARAWHSRVGAAGFQTEPLVRMERPVDTADGADIAAFEIVRVKPGEMAEGRIQMLRHVTEHTVWQTRWLAHPNTAWGLSDIRIAVPDVQEAAARFSRLTGHPVGTTADGDSVILLDRGRVHLTTASAWRHRWPELPEPSLPFIGECTIAVSSIAAARASIAPDAGRILRDWGPDGFSVAFPEPLGVGIWTFRLADPPAGR
jgi:hypothetical protein